MKTFLFALLVLPLFALHAETDLMIPADDVHAVCMAFPAQLFPMQERRQQLICETMSRHHVAISANFLEYCLIDPLNRVDSSYCTDDYAGLGKFGRAAIEFCQRKWTRGGSVGCLQQFIQTDSASH